MDYNETMYDAVSAAADRLFDHDEVTQSELAKAEAIFNVYLEQDDGSLGFLIWVKIPVLHWLGRAYYRQARWRDAKRHLRDAFALSNAVPGTMPAVDDTKYEEIAAFVSDEFGPDLLPKG
jgi:hypothetical protein